MKKWQKRLLTPALVVALATSFVACNGDPADNFTYTPNPSDNAVYNSVFSDFHSLYTEAKKEKNDSKRYALMAIAEAKLLETNAFSFTYANGGNNTISRVAPNTVTNTRWGNDQDRLHQSVVATELIKATDRTALKGAWNKMKEGISPEDDSTGHNYKGKDYSDYAKAYLTSHGYTLKTEYRMGYASEIAAWDVLATSEQVDSEVLVNTYDGLLEYDELGLLQPALASSYSAKLNSDGTQTWTFNIRSGVKWVDAQGRENSELKADDFVAGFQHMMDAQGGLEFLVDGVVVGASDYIAGTETDFSKVGCKATADYTLEYTLENETPYFPTMLGYGVFAPMNRSYFTSHGGAFGVEEFAAAKAKESYVYAKDQNNILYCGPYRVTGFTAESNMTLELNDTYWNKDNINLTKITRLYNDGKITTKSYDDAISGVVDGAALNTTTTASAKASGVFDTYSYVSSVDSTAFMVSYNLNRKSFANWNEATAVVSKKSEKEKDRTSKALLNQNFRLALTHAFDRVAYRTVQTGDASTAVNPLVNSYTPGDYVALTEDVTVKINGTDKTFNSGVFYGEILQAQLDADNAGITVWKEVNGEWKSTGFDGWYNLELAKTQFATAVTELAEQGVEVSADNPIEIDIVYPAFSDTYAGMQRSYKQSIETATANFVKVNLVEATSQPQLTYATYRTRTGADGNYDVCVGWTGWGPDYGDPSTFLDTFLPDGAGYMTKLTGIF